MYYYILGDNMKKYIFLTLFALIIGYLMAKTIFLSYDTDKVFKIADTFYFISVGEYDTYNDMIDSSSKLGDYIYKKDDKYNVIVCITKNIDNTLKISKYYNDAGLNTNILEYNMFNSSLSDLLLETDNLISLSDAGIEELCKKTISKYKEG